MDAGFVTSKTKETYNDKYITKALSHLDDLASVCPTYENLANTLAYAELSI